MKNLYRTALSCIILFAFMGTIFSQSEDCADIIIVETPTIGEVTTENYSTSGGNWTRYRIPISNWEIFPNALFEAAPNLPPCGLNTNASRSWVTIYNGNGSQLNGFCGFNSPSNLLQLWFALPQGDCPPDQVYVSIHDRACDEFYTTNVIDLTCSEDLCGDLVIQANIVSISSSNVQYNYTITNIGTGPVDLNGPTSAEYDNVSIQNYWTNDPNPSNFPNGSPGGGSILGLSPLPILQPGDSYIGTYGSGNQSANYAYLSFKVDWGNSIDECNESNNVEVLVINIPGCTDPSAHNHNPSATEDDGSCETCDDGVQNGDEVATDCGGGLCTPCITSYIDVDGDGFGDVLTSYVGLTVPTGYVENAEDCDDADGSINPAATEVCDNIDNNCDGQIDEGSDGVYDVDADGVAGACDNCPQTANADQSDYDFDGIGDVCDDMLDLDAAIDGLVGVILDLDLPHGLENAFLVKINGALAACENGDPQGAMDKLNAFINQVEAKRGKKLTNQEADDLIAYAQFIIDAIESGESDCGGTEASAAGTSANIQTYQDVDGLDDDYVDELKWTYTNPINTRGNIQIDILKPQKINLSIFNFNGQLIKNIVIDQTYNAGVHQLKWDVVDLQAGIYIYYLSTEDDLKIGKVYIDQ